MSILVFGIFSFLLSCETEVDDPQKKIIITGIPSVYNGRYGCVGFYPQYSNDMIAMSDIIAISNGSVTLPMFVPPQFDKPFTGSGNYDIIFLIGNYSGSTFYWSGGIGPININNETTSISFNRFIAISSLSSKFSLNEGKIMRIIENYRKDQ